MFNLSSTVTNLIQVLRGTSLGLDLCTYSQLFPWDVSRIKISNSTDKNSLGLLIQEQLIALETFMSIKFHPVYGLDNLKS